MAIPDFIVPFDSKVDTNRDLLKRILTTLVIKRLKGNKPAVTFVGGQSGEGKSISTLHMVYLLCQVLKIDDEEFKRIINVMNIYTPLEYPTKLDQILFNKDYKKVRFLIVHEARELVKAGNWQGFINTAISDVNAMSRSVKRLGFYIVAQNIRDIDIKVRYTLNYYIKITRPYKRKARLHFYKVWFDDRDLEKPKLRKSKIKGYLVSPNGKRRPYMPDFIELGMPDKEFVEIFESQDKEAKITILRSKLDKLLHEMNKEMAVDENQKIETMVNYYIKHPGQLKYIGKQRKGKWGTVQEFKKMHDLTPSEVKIFEEKLNDKLKESSFTE